MTIITVCDASFKGDRLCAVTAELLPNGVVNILDVQYDIDTSEEAQEIRASAWAKIVPASQVIVKPASNVRVISGYQY